jgi:hypothetical protein
MTGWDFTGIHSSKEYRDMEKNHVETEGPLWWIYGGKMEKYEKKMYKWWIDQDFHIFSLD